MFKIQNANGVTLAKEDKLCDAKKTAKFFEGVLSEKVSIVSPKK